MSKCESVERGQTSALYIAGVRKLIGCRAKDAATQAPWEFTIQGTYKTDLIVTEWNGEHLVL